MSTVSAIKVQSIDEMPDQQINQLYQTALKAHQNGDFKTAREYYLRVLDLHSAHIKTLYLLGSLYCQTNEFLQGIEYLDKTILLSPEHAEAYSSRGNALNQLQRFDEALQCYVKATGINPEYADAYHNQGITLVNLKRNKEAIASFEEAIRLNPSYAMAYFEKGNVELTLNFYQKAIDNFKQTISLMPTFTDALTHLAYAEKALAQSQHKSANIIESTDLSTQKLSELLSNGEKLEKLNLGKLALEHYQEAVRRYPESVKAYISFGALLKLQNRVAEAFNCFNTAIQLNPNSARAYQKRGEIYTLINRPQDAITDFEAALAINGDLYQYYHAIAFAYRCMGLLDKALECYRLWIRLGAAKRNKYDHAIADFSESIIWLLKGHYLLGWQLYEGRWLAVAERHFRHFKQPLWLGDADITDKHIFLHAEQGFGDTIQMFRYIDLMAKKAAKVTLEVNSPLLRLLKSNTCVDVISKENALPDFDVQCPLMSLPLAFKTTLKTIPAIKLIQPDSETQAIWQQKVQAKIAQNTSKLNIGFVATGNMKHSGDLARSLNFQQLVAFLPAQFNLFCLQKEFRPENAQFLDNNNHIYYFGKQLNDFADTAGLISCMDLVITVDTSVAHLAASMGKPTWILLPFSSDFRWLLDRDDSPWYPAAKLYRQKTLGDWDEVLNRVKTDLASFNLR
ncbi:MAG: tetratricopeptide repeat protein [Pseudomonadota bacterium]